MDAVLWRPVTDYFAPCRDVWIEADLLGYPPDVDDETGDDGRRPQADLPEREITLNMLAGYNMARWRLAADLTQDELGKLLGDWSKKAVSAAERSWDGGRVRQFDADLLGGLSAALGVPVLAFFFPPADDGEAFRYVLRIGAERLGMREWLTRVLPEADPSAEDGPWRQAVDAAAARYMLSEALGRMADRAMEVATEGQLAEALASVQANRAVLDDFYETVDELMRDNSLLQDTLVRALLGTPRGRAIVGDAITGDASPWEGLPELPPGERLAPGDMWAVYSAMLRQGTGTYTVRRAGRGFEVRPAGDGEKEEP